MDFIKKGQLGINFCLRTPITDLGASSTSKLGGRRCHDIMKTNQGVIPMLDYIISRLHKGEEGQTMAEYAVVLAVITVAIVATLGALAGGINGTLNDVLGNL